MTTASPIGVTITRVCFDKEKATFRRAVATRKELLPEVNIELLRCVNGEGDTVVVEAQVDGTTSDGVSYDSPFVCIIETTVTG